MYILQFSPPPRQCTDSLSFPIIFEPIRQFVGYKKPRGAGCSTGQVNSSILRIKLYDTDWTISIAIAA